MTNVLFCCYHLRKYSKYETCAKMRRFRILCFFSMVVHFVCLQWISTVNNVVKEGGFVRGRSQSSQQKKVWIHVDS